MSRESRIFTDSEAVRSSVPLLIGAAGPSGGGKTFSALRLATGIQRVTGGDIFGIDTESKRMLHYADQFKFRHIPFNAPFDSLSYLDAIQHCANKGAKVVVVDSASHEHEGPGGLLDQHAKEIERIAGDDYKKAERVKFLAWVKPKAARQRLINTLLQLPCHFIFCFRAKEKTKIKKGDEPISLGYMPIAGEEFVFEMTVNCLLLPGANGVPIWSPENPGEKEMVKLPRQFAELLKTHNGPLDESIGEKMAEWAQGTTAPVVGKEVVMGEIKRLAEVWKQKYKSENEGADPTAKQWEAFFREHVGTKKTFDWKDVQKLGAAMGETIPD